MPTSYTLAVAVALAPWGAIITSYILVALVMLTSQPEHNLYAGVFLAGATVMLVAVLGGLLGLFLGALGGILLAPQAWSMGVAIGWWVFIGVAPILIAVGALLLWE